MPETQPTPPVQPARPPESPLKRAFVRFLWQLPYIILIYVLSVGPLYWRIYYAYHVETDNWTSRLLQNLYWPLTKAAEIPYVSNFFNWYIGLWIF